MNKMKIQTSLNRLRTQLSGMERMIRTLRAEVENHISAYAPGDIDQVVEVETGLSRMFAEAAPRAPFSARPYDPFVPGVWLGVDQEIGGCSATVQLKCLREPHPDGRVSRVSRLSVNPAFPLAEKPRWLTLETDVDVAALRAAKGLRVAVVSFFDIGPRNNVVLPRDVTLILRLKNADASHSDHLTYRIPVSSMPFEHEVLVPDLKEAGIDFASVATGTVILSFPLAGEFTYYLDHFSLQAIGA